MENSNRTIKFRAWDIGTKQMSISNLGNKTVFGVNKINKKTRTATISNNVESYYFDSKIEKDEILREYFNLEKILYGDRFISMQFTGLLDKNGKEIYEGDIVQNVDDNKYQITFHLGIFGLVSKNSRHYPIRDFDSQLKVIGNICEGVAQIQK